MNPLIPFIFAIASLFGNAAHADLQSLFVQQPKSESALPTLGSLKVIQASGLVGCETDRYACVRAVAFLNYYYGVSAEEIVRAEVHTPNFFSSQAKVFVMLKDGRVLKYSDQ